MQPFSSARALVAGAALFVLPFSVAAQTSTSLDPLGKPTTPQLNPLNQPTLSPGMIFLFQLEGEFAADVAKGGGKAFASWFAPDAITLNNGRAPVMGKTAIASHATWLAKDYQLTWTPLGGNMGPSGDMGYTWGHYEGHSKDKDGNPSVVSGRYMTIWKKQPDGNWKVELDASAEEPPAADCCALPKP